MDPLRKNREAIDEIDASLAELYEARMSAAAEIGAWKQANGLPVRDPARERQVLERAAARIQDPALRPGFTALMEQLMARSRALQQKPRGKTALLTVCLPGGDCPLYLERGILSRAGELLELNRRVFLVTDEGIPAEYVQKAAAGCAAPTVCTVPRGEGSKSVETWKRILEAMLAAGLTRNDCVLALGGGMVCDLAGFAAASYLRGIDCCSIPTTLLAMVDASVGGKTALNLAGVKNVVGAFRQPRAVLMDPEVLATLPPRQLANGLAEAVKMGLTSDAGLFALLERPEGYGPIEEIIARALAVKKAVVEADEREAGLRRVLNFGHTLGHGIEAAVGGALLHGECVALGMLPMCAPSVRARLRSVLKRLGLPTGWDFDPDAALAAIAHDKKSTAEGICAVTVPQVGSWSMETMPLPELRRRLLTLTGAQN